MQYSSAGKKLNPEIANLTAPIYARNPQRYRRLCLWVWRHQKIGWPDEAIAQCLQLAGDNIHLADDWWKYLTALLKKSIGRARESEAERYKRDEANFLDVLLNYCRQPRDRTSREFDICEFGGKCEGQGRTDSRSPRLDEGRMVGKRPNDRR